MCIRDSFTGELISVSYSDGTSPWIFSSNHLGQIISVYDASGLREFSYDSYGRMIQDTSFGQVESSLQEEYDAQGRSNGYRLMLGLSLIHIFFPIERALPTEPAVRKTMRWPA